VPDVPASSDLTTWKAQARAGTAPAAAVLRKGYAAEVKADDIANRRVSFTISTAAPDRDRDTLAVDGWQIDSYLKNPVVLWAHDYSSLPIGRAVSVTPKGKALRAVAEFATAEMNPLAESVYQMLRAGFLNATSVGFRPLKHAYDEERGGFDFMEQELLEFSVVPVPANAQALQDAKSLGLPVEHVRLWAEGVLNDLEPGLWVPAKGRSMAIVPGLSDRLDFTKRGRTLSGANETAIRAALAGITAAAEAIGGVLAQVAEPDEEEPEKVHVQSAQKALYVLPTPQLLVNPNDVKAAMVAAVSEEVEAQIKRARGRLD